MDVSNISTKNKNYKYIFVCVDVYSRKGYAIPMKNRNTLNVIEAFKNLCCYVSQKKLCGAYRATKTPRVQNGPTHLQWERRLPRVETED